MAACALALVLTSALLHVRIRSPHVTSVSRQQQDSTIPVAATRDWSETLTYADGCVRLADRPAASASTTLDLLMEADCSRSRSVTGWTVCQVGPLRPRPPDCAVLASPDDKDRHHLAGELACRWLPLDADGTVPDGPERIDVFLAGEGSTALGRLAAGMRNGWLSGVNQLMLRLASQPTHATGALASLFSGVHRLGFRLWLVQTQVTEAGGAPSSVRLHFINRAALVIHKQQQQQQTPFPAPEIHEQSHPVVEVSLRSDFNLQGTEREINAALARNQSAQMESLYFSLVRRSHADCPDSRRVGQADDGGWDVCFSRPYSIRADAGRSGCVAFSFGINYVYEYDNALSTEFGCTVRMFDPSMTNVPDQRIDPRRRQWFYQRGLAGRTGKAGAWRMQTLCSALEEFTEPGQLIDILKIDIELWEWESLELALTEGCLQASVKQLLFETHTILDSHGGPINYARFLRVWLGLLKAGFRVWKWHINPQSVMHKSLTDGRPLPCCHEHYMINWRFAR